MSQVRKRPTCEAGRSDADYEIVRVGQRDHNTTFRSSLDRFSAPHAGALLPPSVPPLDHAQHAPDLTVLFCGDDWQECLERARQQLSESGEVVRSLGLPLDKDPVIYRWPVAGRHVLIYGLLELQRLRRLFDALLKDGARSAVGSDKSGARHVASIPLVDDMEDDA